MLVESILEYFDVLVCSNEWSCKGEEKDDGRREKFHGGAIFKSVLVYESINSYVVLVEER